MNESDLHTLTRRSLSAIRELKAENARLRMEETEPIAIVAMTCRFPANLNSPQDYWSLMHEGRDALSDLPGDRWPLEQFYTEGQNLSNGIYVRRGGFLDSLASFDRNLFKLSEEDALAMDPQQRILVELCWQALEIANMAPDPNPDVVGNTTGVFIGIANAGYSRFSLHSGDPSLIGPKSVPGFAPSFASGRLSYLFGLNGPTQTIDTACSSSLVALHTACASLRNRECNCALVGGVNALIAPEEYIYFCNAAALSPSSRSRPFSAEADGYVRAEGGAVLALKRLSDAQRDGNRIEALINGSAVNHDGRSNGLTAPNGESQKALLRAAYANSGVDPCRLGYVEAHGTGTLLGDPIEATALGEYLLEVGREIGKPVPIGSVKSNLGHLEAAAGLAGVIKSVLALQHREIPPTLISGRLNPHVDWEKLPIEVVRDEPRPWAIEEDPFHAGVSSFGFSGTNAHVVLTSVPKCPPNPEVEVECQTVPIVVTAACPDALQQSLIRLAERAENATSTDVQSIARTLAIGRAQLPYGIHIEVDEPSTLSDRLRKHASRVGLESSEWADSEVLSVARAKAANLPVSLTELPTYPFQHERFWPCDGTFQSATKTSPQGYEAEPFDSDRDTLDRYLHRTVGELLGVDEAFVASRSGLAEFDLDSITLVKLKFLLEQGLGIEVPLMKLSEKPDWKLLSSFLESSKPVSKIPSKVLSNPGPTNGIALTPLQQAYWVGRRISDEHGACGSYFYLEFEAYGVSAETLEASWNVLIQRHQMLKASVTNHEILIENDRPHYHIVRHDLSAGDDVGRLSTTAAIRAGLSQRTFRSGAWPLFVVEACERTESTRVFFGIDEVIADGSSINVLLREWQALAEHGAKLEPLEYEYSQYATFIAERCSDPSSALTYWENASPASALAGPALSRSGATPTGTRKRLRAVLGAEVSTSLEEEAKALQVSLTALVLHRFASVLATHTARKDFTLILTYFNRLPIHPSVDNLVGPLASTTLFTWHERMEPDAVQARLLSDAEHTHVDGVTVIRHFRRKGLLDANTTFPVVFTSMIENVDRDPKNKKSWSRACSHVVSQTPQVLLDHQIGRRGDSLVLSWDYAADFLDEREIERLFDVYGAALSGIPAPILESAKYPATAVQRSYAYGYQVSGRSCQIYQELRCEQIDPARVETAWRNTIRRYAALRCCLDEAGMLQTADPSSWRLARPLTCRDENDEQLVERRRVLSVSKRGPTIWPPFEIALTQLENGDDIVHMSIDMIAADFPSQHDIHAFFCTAMDSPDLSPSIHLPTFAPLLNAEGKRHLVQSTKSYWQDKLKSLRPAALRGADRLKPGDVIRLSETFDGWDDFATGCAACEMAPQDMLAACFSSAVSALTSDGAVPLVQVDFERSSFAGREHRDVGDFTRLAWAQLNPQKSSLEELAGIIQKNRDADWQHDPDQGLGYMGRFGPHRRGGTFALPFVFSRLLAFEVQRSSGAFTLGRGVSSTPGVAIDDVSIKLENSLALTWDIDLGIVEKGAVDKAFAYYGKLVRYIAENPSSLTEVM